MSARDEVAKLTYGEGAFCGDCEYLGWDECPVCRRVCLDYADAILAAGYSKPRTITTVEELDALPGESIIRDGGGMVYELDYIVDNASRKWWITTGNDAHSQNESIELPATVLYTPKES